MSLDQGSESGADSLRLPMELRAVVFGGKFAGKTTLINAVFGKGFLLTKKRTAQCEKVQGNVCGRKLTLVDTPGWWKHFPLSDTANFLKKELVQGVSFCKPGPHAILLVIEIDIPFTEKHRTAAVDHLALLGDQIWTQTLVLFTRSRSLGNRTIEEHIEKEGEALKWLIERCGNRYHVFDSTVLDNTSQVKQLLEKIEGMVQINDGAHFQIETKILEEAAEWKTTVMTRAESRKRKQQERLDKEELRIALLGWVVAGKSSAGNTILNKKVFVTDQSTLKCQSGHGEVDGRSVTVLDTPSWFKYFPAQYTPAWIKSGIFNGVCQTLTPPHCILLVIPADTSFHEEQRKVIEENMSLLGEQVWKHTILLFTSGDILGDVTIEQHIESEGEALQWVVEKCENRYHIFNNEERENRVQVTELLQKIDQMMAQNSSFQPNTDTTGGIQTKQEEHAQIETTDEYNLQDIVQFVDEEWRRRDKELWKRVSKVMKDIKAQRGSMDFPLDLSETRLNTETEDHTDEKVSQTEATEFCYVGAVQDEAKSSLKLKDHIKEMLDREWSRREEAVMGRFLEMLSELRHGETCLNTETGDSVDEEVTQTESCNVGTVQDEAESSLTLKDQIKEMLDRDWSRREETLMGRFLDILSNQAWEIQSDPTDDDKERAQTKVSQWLQKYSEGYSSASSSVQSHN
ncbi:GTPase IMAP family member 8-like isoform X2 [Pygocentrus nattereri]|uniref:GTPase IMAP family member 8-like isoform X2 n=1 Tax=Pygocentrus nattereri TaxID=42514 RepID=UPI0018914ACF|nr:GTPase IMAP family member 8-like isoform X2 [Pygocentrus nattereri]